MDDHVRFSGTKYEKLLIMVITINVVSVKTVGRIFGTVTL